MEKVRSQRVTVVVYSLAGMLISIAALVVDSFKKHYSPADWSPPLFAGSEVRARTGRSMVLGSAGYGTEYENHLKLTVPDPE